MDSPCSAMISLVKSQYTVSTAEFRRTAYNPFKVCPSNLISWHDAGIWLNWRGPWLALTSPPEHTNFPRVWAPDERSNLVRPKCMLVIGSISLSVITPAYLALNQNQWGNRKELALFIPVSFENVGRRESQLHGIEGSMQLPSMPHWQMWASVLLPDQKYWGLPCLSFHQEKWTPLKCSGASVQSYFLKSECVNYRKKGIKQMQTRI